MSAQRKLQLQFYLTITLSLQWNNKKINLWLKFKKIYFWKIGYEYLLTKGHFHVAVTAFDVNKTGWVFNLIYYIYSR